MAGALKRPGCIKRQCVVMRAPWVGQTGDAIYDVTIARHQTLCSYTQCHPHRLPGVHRSVKNQAKQNIYSVLFRRESDAALLRDHPPPTYSCRDCLLSIRLWVNIGLSKFKGNNSSFTSLIIIKAVQ